MGISNVNKVRKSILPIFTQCLLPIQVSEFLCHCAWTDARRSIGPKLGLCMCVLSRFSRVRLCEALRISACQTPLSMGFFRQEYWSGLPCPLEDLGDLPKPGIEPVSLMSNLLWQAGSLPLAHHLGSPKLGLLEYNLILNSIIFLFYLLCKPDLISFEKKFYLTMIDLQYCVSFRCSALDSFPL